MERTVDTTQPGNLPLHQQEPTTQQSSGTNGHANGTNGHGLNGSNGSVARNGTNGFHSAIVENGAGGAVPAVEPGKNLLLESLPAATREALQPHLEPVALPAGTPLFDLGVTPRYVHFLTSGMASIVTNMQGGESIEVGLVGRKGTPESLHLLGPQMGMRRCFMQVSGAGLRVRYKKFEEEFFRDPLVHSMVLQYVQYSTLVLSQIAACNRLHEVEPRLARWLLMVEDRVGNLDFDLTQEFLAEMLGTRRPTVTIVAGGLQRKGLIAYGRKRIRIIDRAGLMKIACECYPVTLRLYNDLYKQQIAVAA